MKCQEVGIAFGERSPGVADYPCRPKKVSWGDYNHFYPFMVSRMDCVPFLLPQWSTDRDRGIKPSLWRGAIMFAERIAGVAGREKRDSIGQLILQRGCHPRNKGFVLCVW